MGLRNDYDEGQTFTDVNFEDEFEQFEPIDESEHKKRIRRMIEDRLERKRLKEEFEDEWDGEFDWDDVDQ